MVKKLFKHEFKAHVRYILPMHLILLGIALLGRFVQIFDNNSTAYNIVFWSSVIAFAVACVVCTILTFVFGIKRFYTNLFTKEGYLTLTLPVRSNAHIWTKLIVAVTSQLFSLFMIALSLCAITLGDVCKELFKALFYLIKCQYIEDGFHVVTIILLFITSFIISIAASYELIYACIALGQTRKKNRVASAVGFFFIYYFFTQIIATVFIIICSVYYEELRLPELFDYLYKHPILKQYVIYGGIAVIEGILGLIYHAITKHIISKKLNLE